VRLAAAVAGLLLVVFSVQRAGPALVLATLGHAAFYAPLAALLEASAVCCDMAALRILYGPDREKVPLRSFAWAGLVGYPLMCLVPMGRAVAEAARAAMLSKYVGAGIAAAAATRLQAVLLLANAIVSILCALAAFRWGAANGPVLAIAANAVLTLVLGAGILWAGARSSLGARLAKLSARAEHFGPAFDAGLRSGPGFPIRSVALSFTARIFQIAQYSVLVAAVAGRFDLVLGLLAEGVNLVGATVGDLIPAQLGATEATFTWSAGLLSISPSDAVSVALLAHAVQLFWVVVGLVAPLVPSRVAAT
jgi:hypothetical protein